jgi:hypothetical protein
LIGGLDLVQLGYLCILTGPFLSPVLSLISAGICGKCRKVTGG